MLRSITNLFNIKKVFFASGSFFRIFTYPLIAGDGDNALTNHLLLLYLKQQPEPCMELPMQLARDLTLNRNSDYTITAVYKDAPANTQLKPDILLSYATFIKFVGPNNNPETAWPWDGCLTYLLLRKGADPAVVEKKFIPVVEKFTAADMKRFNAAVTYSLQPLSDIHLYSHYMAEPETNGDGKTVYLLLGIAFFIAIIAWVNYINLATARAVNRAKEVGIRKTVGSQRKQLIAQFLSESALLNGIALVLALLIVASCYTRFQSAFWSASFFFIV